MLGARERVARYSGSRARVEVVIGWAARSLAGGGCVWLLALGATGPVALAGEVTFTSSPPSQPVVGGSYTASAVEVSGGEIYLLASGACSVRTVEEVRKVPLPTHPPSPRHPPIVVHFVEAGECLITATGASEYGVQPAESSQSLLVGRGPQTVRFASSAPTNATVRGKPYNVAAQASSGLSPKVVSKAGSVCVVMKDAVRFVGAGTCTLEASQGGNKNYLAARPVLQTFKVREARRAHAM